MPRGIYSRPTPEERFRSLVQVNQNGCWDWIGRKDVYGYSVFFLNGRLLKAHRYSYVLHKGEIPEGLECAHTCRNQCVNPDHIELKTHAENCRDKIRDGTYTKGDSHHFTVVSDEQLNIFKQNLPEEGKLNYYKEQARLLGVSWKHLQHVSLGRVRV